MWTLWLWRSLGSIVGVTGSAVVVRLTPYTPGRPTLAACHQLLVDEAFGTLDTQGRPQGHLPVLSK
jgi:hypothetical protein